MNVLPVPLVPANVDLRSMPEMPLDVALLRSASITVSITDEGFKAAVNLWCCAWHECPSASLPDDDKMLANLAGYGRDVSGWMNVREQALWKFIKCSDGRLYHPTIAEKAIRVWEYRENYRRRMELARAAKAAAIPNRPTRNGHSNTRSITEIITGAVIGPVSALNQTKLSKKDSTQSNQSRKEPIMAGDFLREQLAEEGLRGAAK